MRGSNPGHTRSAKPIENNIAGFGVVIYVPHDGLMRHLGVVAVGVIDWVVLAFAHVRCEWFLVIRYRWIIGFAVMLDEILDKGIWAGGVIGWIRQRQNVLVRADGKSLDLAEGWPRGSTMLSRNPPGAAAAAG